MTAAFDPILAILRGLRPAEAEAVGQTLYAAGIRSLEVPLNSPDPLASIAILRDTLPSDATIGAGTVLTVADVERCAEAGSELVVSPHTNADLIAATLHAGMRSLPGCATPSEAITALSAGTETLKVFPAGTIGPAGLKAWREVLPRHIQLFPVGGVTAADFPAWVAAGASGFGVGAALYSPGIPLTELAGRGQALIAAWSAAGAPVTAGIRR